MREEKAEAVARLASRRPRLREEDKRDASRVRLDHALSPPPTGRLLPGLLYTSQFSQLGLYTWLGSLLDVRHDIYSTPAT
jgi:hypothetical protein